MALLAAQAFSSCGEWVYTSFAVHVGFLLLYGSVDKEPTCNTADTEDLSLVPGSGRSPGGRNGNPLQVSYK